MQGTFDMKFQGSKAEIQKLLDYLVESDFGYLFEDAAEWEIVPENFDELPDSAETWLARDLDSSGDISGIYELCEECVSLFPSLRVDYCEELLDSGARGSFFSLPGSTELLPDEG